MNTVQYHMWLSSKTNCLPNGAHHRDKMFHRLEIVVKNCTFHQFVQSHLTERPEGICDKLQIKQSVQRAKTNYKGH